MYWEYFERTKPRKAKNGIKAQSKRGAFGKSWWAKQWIQVLESFQIGQRLARGRSYARNGQVTSIQIDKGMVTAKVQGSRSGKYSVQIRVKVLSGDDKKRLAALIAEQPIYAAKLLAGEIPQDIESILKPAGLSLFVSKKRDLQTDCSCPDWSNPCKHVAAVYYLIGEQFDNDPFLIFKLRGLDREELLGMIGDLASDYVQDVDTASTDSSTDDTRDPSDLPAEPLTANAESFWNGSKPADDIFTEVRIPQIAATLPKRLGQFTFWQGREDFLPFMESIYSTASSTGLKIFLSDND